MVNHFLRKIFRMTRNLLLCGPITSNSCRIKLSTSKIRLKVIIIVVRGSSNSDCIIIDKQKEEHSFIKIFSSKFFLHDVKLGARYSLYEQSILLG